MEEVRDSSRWTSAGPAPTEAVVPVAAGMVGVRMASAVEEGRWEAAVPAAVAAKLPESAAPPAPDTWACTWKSRWYFSTNARPQVLHGQGGCINCAGRDHVEVFVAWL